MSDPLTTPHPLPCGLTLPDRVVLAPLTNTQSHSDGTLGDDELRWLVRRARDGFRSISTCAAYVSEEGKAWDGQLGVASDAHLPGLTRLATALHQAGAVAWVQLHHAGAKADEAPGLRLTTTDDPAQGWRGATADDLARVQRDYVEAALRAQAAGFDGVEIHGANGYLFTQFLGPLSNPRTDRWGGDLAGRARLLRDVVRAVRAAVRTSFAVLVRISPVDAWERRGLVVEDAATLVGWLAEDGADAVHLSLGDAAGPPPGAAEGAEPVATTLRRALPEGVALLGAGGITSRDQALRAREAGLDAVVVGRAGIRHPDLPRRLADPGFAMADPPWSPDDLRAMDVGEALITYLQRFPGLVEGGRPARG